MWRSKPKPLRLTLAPVTVGRYLAVRAAAGVGYVEGEGGDGPPVLIEALTDDALKALLSEALTTTEGLRFADRAGLVRTARDVYDLWQEEAMRQVALGVERGRIVRLHTGCKSPDSLVEDPPPEAIAGRHTLVEWAALRDLPLWEVVMQGIAADSWQAMQRLQQTN